MLPIIKALFTAAKAGGRLGVRGVKFAGRGAKKLGKFGMDTVMNEE